MSGAGMLRTRPSRRTTVLLLSWAHVPARGGAAAAALSRELGLAATALRLELVIGVRSTPAAGEPRWMLAAMATDLCLLTDASLHRSPHLQS